MLEGLPETLQHGPIRVDVRRFKAWHGTREVHLTLRQFEVLLYLLINRHRVVMRQELLRSHWFTPVRPGRPDRTEETIRAVDVAIYGLRRVLGPGTIDTVRGVGYRLADVAGEDPRPERPPMVSRDVRPSR
jgi:two-component system copper resistance phosphate regulon response regulator CusR